MNLTNTQNEHSGVMNVTDFQNNVTTTTKSVQQTFLIPWDNPANVIGYEMRKDIIFVMECIIFPIVTAFGCTGNVMSFVILMTKKLRNSTGVILVALTIADFCFLVTNIVRKSACIVARIDEVFEVKYSATIFSPFFYMITSFGRVSAWLVVLISIERLIAVTFPMKIKRWVSKQRMVIAVCLIYVFTFFLFSPIAAQYERGSFFNPRTNQTIYRIQNTEFYDNNKDLLAVHNEIIGTILFRYIPVLLTMVFNLIIIIILQRRKVWRKAKTSKKDDKVQSKITKMLLIISGVCILCTSPGSLFLITYRLVPGFELFGKYHNIFLVMSDCSILLSMLNSSVNFIIYMVFNQQFSEMYRKIFCHYCGLQNVFTRWTDSSVMKSDTNSKVTEVTSGVFSSNEEKEAQINNTEECDDDVLKSPPICYKPNNTLEVPDEYKKNDRDNVQ